MSSGPPPGAMCMSCKLWTFSIKMCAHGAVRSCSWQKASVPSAAAEAVNHMRGVLCNQSNNSRKVEQNSTCTAVVHVLQLVVAGLED